MCHQLREHYFPIKSQHFYWLLKSSAKHGAINMNPLTPMVEKRSNYLYGSHFFYLNVVSEVKMSTTVGRSHLKHPMYVYLQNLEQSQSKLNQFSVILDNFLDVITFFNVCAAAASTSAN